MTMSMFRTDYSYNKSFILHPTKICFTWKKFKIYHTIEYRNKIQIYIVIPIEYNMKFERIEKQNMNKIHDSYPEIRID